MRTILNLLVAAVLLGATQANLAEAGQAEPPTTRQTVAPPPGFIDSCRRYAWFCEQGPVGTLTSAELMAAATRINRQVNASVREMSDFANYGSTDRWVLPTNGNGDCEDFVLEKFRLLLSAGADSRDLSIAIVLDRNGDNHAVLVLRHEDGDMILDNLERGIRPWNQTSYRYLAMQARDDKREWEVVAYQPRDRMVLAER